MRRLGAALVRVIPPGLAEPLLIAINGELGAGKTTLVSGLLAGAGCPGPHRSPTYTLIESYDSPRGRIHHLDLYRLANTAEIEAIGLRDLLEPGAVVLVEWAARAGPLLSARADLTIALDYVPDDAAARSVSVVANSAPGALILAPLASLADAELVSVSS